MDIENLSRRKFLGVAAIAGGAIGLEACSSSQLTSALNAIEEGCQLVPVGTTLIGAIISSIPALSPAAPIVQTIGSAAASDCSAFVTALQNTIKAITAQGASAV
ncbi:unnamed protein product [Sphagnum balticum]